MRHGFQGPNHSVSTACATGAHSIGILHMQSRKLTIPHAFHMIHLGDAANFVRLGAAKAMVCGGTESCIIPLSLAGISRLRALSTKFNDKPELLSRPFDVSSMKGALGHGQGAAGAVEACLSIKAIHQAMIPPNLNLERPDPKTFKLNVRLCATEAQSWNVERRVLLKNSFGFGGTNASLSIASYC